MVEVTRWRAPLDAEVAVPGDKSLTHRGILFSVVTDEEMVLEGWLDAADTRSSLGLVQRLGVEVLAIDSHRLVLRGLNQGPKEPESVLECGNSGTTMRLACGLAAGVNGLCVLSGDASLVRRPMARVIEPLRQMGVEIVSRRGGYAPLAIQGGRHRGGRFALPVASAQVKSALLLAGLTADDPVEVEEPVKSRDHTEHLLQAMGGRIRIDGQRVRLEPGRLHGLSFTVPGDPSSAAFWAALAALSSDRKVTIPSILFNSTRTGFLGLLARAGAEVTWHQEGTDPEPWGWVSVAGRMLTPVALQASDVPAMVDEVPLVALIATQARGTSVIQGAGELRLKESDRIRVTADILSAMGADIQEREDGWVIEGPTQLSGADIDAKGDHRMAMLAAIAATVADGVTRIHGEESVAISYPDFFAQYRRLQRIAR